MKKKFANKIEITITDPWDSKETIIGFVDRPIWVGNLESLLIHSETGEWVALLPRYKGQKLSNELSSKQKFVINVARLKVEEFSSDVVSLDHILSYAFGNAELLE